MSSPLDRAHMLLFDFRRPELAEKELRQALAADPNDAHAHALLAYALGRQRRFIEAQSEARQAIHLAPEDPFAHRVRAWLKGLWGHTAEVDRAYREVLRLNPHDAFAHEALAHNFFIQDRLTEALDMADRGLAHDPEHVGCLNRRAQALAKLGRLEQAQEAIDAALRIDPADAESHATHGWIASLRRQTLHAMQSCRIALELNPEDAETRAHLRALLLAAAEGPVVLLTVLAALTGGIGLTFWNAFEPDGLALRLLCAAGTILIVPTALSLVHEPLKLTWLRLTPWGRFVVNPQEQRAGTRAALGCAILGFVNALLWAFWPTARGALCGTLFTVAIALPFLARVPGETYAKAIVRVLILAVASVICAYLILTRGKVEAAFLFLFAVAAALAYGRQRTVE
jgi:Flp pilus assembly protein TadD